MRQQRAQQFSEILQQLKIMKQQIDGDRESEDEGEEKAEDGENLDDRHDDNEGEGIVFNVAHGGRVRRGD